MMKAVLNTILIKADHVSGGFIAYSPDFEGVVSQGVTEAEAIDNLKEDIEIVEDFKEKIEAGK